MKRNKAKASKKKKKKRGLSKNLAKNARKALEAYEKAKQQQRVGDNTMELGIKTHPKKRKAA